METSSSNSMGDHAGPQKRSKDPSIFCFCTLLGTLVVSLEAGFTISGFPGISGGKVPIRSCPFEGSHTPGMGTRALEIRGPHAPGPRGKGQG